ncbi:MAG: hypothetical protein R3181_07650 [Rubricoccaceae bacterium]|nr:hypothetical protein [Rubricoccaceae bacterium]
MGKLAFLLVMAAIIGGTTLTYSTYATVNEHVRARGETQADVLAREAATSGHGLLLNAALDTRGFRSSPGFSGLELANSFFTVDDYTVETDGTEVTFTVTGHSGGARHTIRSRYAWDPLDLPGPIWFDVPFASAQLDPGAVLSGGEDARPVVFDRRRFDDNEVGTLLPFSTMRAALEGQLATAGGNSGLSVPNPIDPLLEDLNLPEGSGHADDLFYAALAAMGDGDVTLPANTVLAGAAHYGATPRIVHATGPLTVGATGALTGSGVLAVAGDLTVESGGRLDWNGLVVLHSDEPVLHLRLDGQVALRGAVAVSQNALPPGGHMDLTVMRDLDGRWSSPKGDRTGSPWAVYGDYPWFQHKHRFDLDLPEGQTVYFAEAGRDRHEEWTQFRDALDQMGSQEVYLEFAQTDRHGYATYRLDLAGQPTRSGLVKNGWGLFAGSRSSRSRPFPASDLRSFIIDVQSLRVLRDRFDGRGCAEWPRCIGGSWERGRALTVRLRRNSGGRLLYEGTLYWHMRSDEVAEHEEEERRWREAILNGAEFGTRLTMGGDVSLAYDIDAIRPVADRLGFDGDETHHRGTWTEHLSATQVQQRGLPPVPPPGGSD